MPLLLAIQSQTESESSRQSTSRSSQIEAVLAGILSTKSWSERVFALLLSATCHEFKFCTQVKDWQDAWEHGDGKQVETEDHDQRGEFSFANSIC